MQVFSAVQAHDPSCITPEHLHMALLAWLQLKHLTAATSALQSHDALAVKQKDAAVPLLQSVCIAGVKGGLPLVPMQVHELVMAVLSMGQTQNAFQVSVGRIGTELHSQVNIERIGTELCSD